MTTWLPANQVPLARCHSGLSGTWSCACSTSTPPPHHCGPVPSTVTKSEKYLYRPVLTAGDRYHAHSPPAEWILEVSLFFGYGLDDSDKPVFLLWRERTEHNGFPLEVRALKLSLSREKTASLFGCFSSQQWWPSGSRQSFPSSFARPCGWTLLSFCNSITLKHGNLNSATRILL